MGAVKVGLSTIALEIDGLSETTLGDNNVLGDSCMSYRPTLGSGMGSRKVTVFLSLLFSLGSAGALLRMLFIFCSAAISSFPRRLLL
jgi:hypothetical protein